MRRGPFGVIGVAALALCAATGTIATGAGCHGEVTPPAPPGDDTASYVPDASHELAWQGRQRTYRLHLPVGKPWSNLPLVIVLHGAGSTADEVASYTHFDPIGDRDRFAVVYPNAVDRLWNAGGPWQTSIDDVGYIGALIDHLLAHYPLDGTRVFVAGHSNGAFMAYRLARERSGKITAIAPVAGGLYDTPYGEPPSEVSIIHMHALDDPIVPFGGAAVGGVHMVPVDSTLAYFIRRQHCAARPDTLVAADGVLGLRWRSASGHGDVILYTTASGGHGWPTWLDRRLAGTETISAFFQSLPAKRPAT